MSLGSKKIEDYFSHPLRELIASDSLPFDIYLYFKMNQHLMLWRTKTDVLLDEFLKKYSKRGIQDVWIHKSDRSLFDQYLSGEIEDKKTTIIIPKKRKKDSIEGDFMSRMLHSRHLTQEQKKAVIQEAAQEIIAQQTEAASPEEQSEKNKNLREIVYDFFKSTPKIPHSSVTDIIKLSLSNSEFEHAMDVSAYAVLFSMAFGRIDQDLLSDITLAALLHDIGLSQLPIEITCHTQKDLSEQNHLLYQTHVRSGIDLIDDFAPEITNRVKAIIGQHHEKFDGSGYPARLSSFEFDDVAQLVSLANRIVCLESGIWDGEQRTFKESLFEIAREESIKPKYFNPELFQLLLQWADSADSQFFESSEDYVTQISKNLGNK